MKPVAGAVRAEEAEHLAALHGERNAVDRALRSERLDQILDFDHGFEGRHYKGIESANPGLET
jgi:hypothetical protein